MADLCIDSSYIADDALVTGVGSRRLNGILDLLSLPFCAADVQDYFSTVAENLASMKLNNVHQTAAMTASITGGAVGGFLLIPGLGTATVKGAERFLGDVTQVDKCSWSCAHLLACAMAASRYADGSKDVWALADALEGLAVKAAQEFAFGRSHSANIYTGDTAHADRHRKIVTAAFSVAQELVAPETVTMPDVVGMPFSAAHDLLVAVGVEVCGTASNDRSIMNKNNWVVSKQRSLPGVESARGKTVTLEVRKFSD